MARPIWKGNISFGLVNVPIALYSAEQKNELHFKLLDKRTKSAIRYERVSEATGEPIPWEEVVKGYEYDSGDYVVLTDEDFKKAAVEATRTIEISDFVPLDSIEYKYFEKPYYVVPGKKAEKGYVLLREILRRSGKVAISKVVIRSRQYLAALAPEGNALMLALLRYYDELRDVSEFVFPSATLEDYKVTEKELQIAGMLVDGMTSQWEPQKYRDEYREALMSWIEEKAKAGGVMPVGRGEEQPERAGKIIDMMELLKKSVEEVRKKRKKPTAGSRREKAA
ncbi:MAG: Ku protein [Syntrophobacteraceae bacterium]|nr:Ku protein [Syntrophobacteraceae bacterium]